MPYLVDTVDIDKVVLSPKILASVDKICRYVYGDSEITEKMAALIGITTDIHASKDFLRALTNSRMLELIEEIFTDPKYEKLRYDNWNVYGDFVREWPGELETALERSGITYDKDKKSFKYNNRAVILNFERGLKESFLPFKVSDVLYTDLISEINKCYDLRLPTATYVLSRKLIENLVIDVLRKKFSSDSSKLDMYFDTSHKRFQDFSKLLYNLKNSKNSFLGFENVIEEIVSLADEYRDTANKSAHSIFSYGNLEDLIRFKIPDLVRMLIGLFDKL